MSDQQRSGNKPSQGLDAGQRRSPSRNGGNRRGGHESRDGIRKASVVVFIGHS